MRRGGSGAASDATEVALEAESESESVEISDRDAVEDSSSDGWCRGMGSPLKKGI